MTPPDGVLVIDKPSGPTSHDVVARVRRATGWTKVGHTGTLDPMATGVLALVVGRATRLARFLSAADKVYEAEVRLGFATDTYDALGRPSMSPSSEVHSPVGPTTSDIGRPTSDDLEAILDCFRGTYEQPAPPFSAKKVDGVRAYALARKGVAVAPKSASVTVHELTLLARSDDRLRFRIRCSAGFYVRTFAHELGIRLGAGAHLSALRRTKSGEFDAADAVSLEEVECAGRGAASRVAPLERMLASMPAVVVNGPGEVRTRHGNDLRAQDLVSVPDGFTTHVRVLDERGGLVAIAEPAAGGLLHPSIVVG